MRTGADSWEAIRLRARALVVLHDRLMEEAEAAGEAPADSFERWCAAIEELRAVLPPEGQG